MMPTDSDLVGLFQKHLVPIFFSCQKDKEIQNFVVTSFVLSIKSQWFLITAGHCISKIEKLTNKHGYKIENCYLIDSLGLNSRYRNPIPFDYITSKPLCLSENGDFDYGVILLSSYYQELLEANHIQPLNEEVWKKQPAKIDFYTLMGVPHQLTKVALNNIEITTTLHKIELLDKKPDEFPDTDAPLFYGRITLDDSVTNIEGMSGGPIFGFFKNDKNELRYWLIALQSTWLKQSGFIKACPTHLLGRFLEETLKKRNNDVHVA
jgi:hypothetical protein